MDDQALLSGPAASGLPGRHAFALLPSFLIRAGEVLSSSWEACWNLSEVLQPRRHSRAGKTDRSPGYCQNYQTRSCPLATLLADPWHPQASVQKHIPCLGSANGFQLL